MESKNFDFSAIIRIVSKNIKVFITVAIVSAVLAVVFSSKIFLTPLFKSVAVVYPINIKAYGEESTTEQMLQIFQSGDIMDSVIDKFDLYERYDIEKGVASSKYYMNQEYHDRVMTSKTTFESIRLEVLDESPDTAKLMADEIIRQLNLKIRSFYNERGLDRSETYRKQMAYQLAFIDSVQQHISELSSENRVMQYESQTRELVRGYVEALKLGPNSDQANAIEGWLKDLQKSGSQLESLQEISRMAAEQFGEISFKFLDYRAIGVEEVSYTDVVVSPEVPDRKAWPVRWLILLLSVAGACVITLIILAIAKRH